MTTVVQTTYRPQIAALLLGRVSTEVPDSIATGITETAAGIGFGLAVSQGALSDRGVILGGSAFKGVSVRDITQDTLPLNPLATGEAPVDTYPQYANIAVCSRGWITVYAGANVKAGDPLFYSTTTGLFTNSASGSAAVGQATFTTIPSPNDTITLNGDVWTFVAGPNNQGSKQIAILGTLGDTLANAATVLNASVAVNTVVLSYQAYPPSPGGAGQGSGSNTLMYADKTVGVAGNALVVAASSGSVTVSGTGGALAGGSAAATAITGGYWVDSSIAGGLAQISLGIQR